MADVYESLLSNNLGRSLLNSLNLPVPTVLERHSQTQTSFVSGNVLIGAAPGGRMLDVIVSTLKQSNATVQVAQNGASLNELKQAGEKAELNLATVDTSAEGAKFKALVFDATGIESSEQTRELYNFFHPVIRKLADCARVIVIGTPPESCKSNPKAQIAQRSLEGFVRSVGKEIGKKGATAQLIWMAPGAETQLESTVRFFLSPKAAFVSGQVVRISKRDGKGKTATNNIAPLTGKVALVTGASRGIGESVARVLARDGATVVCLDVPAAMAALEGVANSINGKALAADITEQNGPKAIADYLEEHFKGVDLVVHNAGITRDKTLGRMPDHFWDLTIAVNLTAEELINDELINRKLLRSNGRIVCVSSISGIAGNFGQTNYATSKCGVIGYVEAMAKQLKDGVTINAVAPGFIETQMTAAMPITIREAGRRMNSLSQGGLPVDVAETIAYYCNPLSGGVNGNIIRVCGQSLIGK